MDDNPEEGLQSEVLRGLYRKLRDAAEFPRLLPSDGALAGLNQIIAIDHAQDDRISAILEVTTAILAVCDEVLVQMTAINARLRVMEAADGDLDVVPTIQSKSRRRLDA